MTEVQAAPQAAEQVAVTAQEPSEPKVEAKENGQSEQQPKPPEEMVPLKKLNRVRAALGDSERDRQAMRDRIAELEKQLSPPPDDEPKLENFNSPDEYAEAKADWKYRQREKAEAEKSKQPTEQKIAERARNRALMESNFKTREAAWMKENPGYNQAAQVVNDMVSVMNQDHPTFKAFEEAVFTQEKAPQLIQFLGENPKEIGRLARMSPVEITMALEEIIEGLGAPKPQEDGPPEETAEALPEPIKPVAGNAKPRRTTMDILNDPKSSGTDMLNALEKIRGRRG